MEITIRIVFGDLDEYLVPVTSLPDSPFQLRWNESVTRWYDATVPCSHTQSMDCGGCVPPEYYGERYFSDNPVFNERRLSAALARKRTGARLTRIESARWHGVAL